MPSPSRQQLREWSRALTLDAIDPASPTEKRYVALSEAGRSAVDELQATIELAFDTTTQLLSGPNGSGKTTELNRLRGELRKRGYLVTTVNIRDYVNESSPIDVTEFLIGLALAANDAYDLPPSATRPDFGVRLGGLLRRLKVSVEMAGAKADISSEGLSVGAPGISASVSLKSELKSSEPFVSELRSKLSYHVGELYDDVAAFLAELLSVGVANTEPSGAVLIVDGLEKLQGTSTNDREVQESVERLFVAHASKLMFPSHHVIYTAPTYLMFTNPGALPYSSRVLPVPVPYVLPRTLPNGDKVQTDQKIAQTKKQLREVVEKRIPIDVIFGQDNNLLETIIASSGGHLRDLFTILNQLLNLILRQSIQLPVTADAVDEAIRNVEHDFGSITREQADFLEKVNKANGDVRPTVNEVGLMARLLQQHMLLSHMNGADWYEVHPLAKRVLGLS
jgi:hypothetical protein